MPSKVQRMASAASLGAIAAFLLPHVSLHAKTQDVGEPQYHSDGRILMHTMGIRSLPPSYKVHVTQLFGHSTLVLTQNIPGKPPYQYVLTNTHVMSMHNADDEMERRILHENSPHCREMGQYAQRAPDAVATVHELRCIAPGGISRNILQAFVPVSIYYNSMPKVDIHGRVIDADGYYGDVEEIFPREAYLVSDIRANTIWHEGHPMPNSVPAMHCNRCELVLAPDNADTWLTRLLDFAHLRKTFVAHSGAYYYLTDPWDAEHAMLYYRDRPYANEREATHDPYLAGTILTAHEMFAPYTFINIEQIGPNLSADALRDVVKYLGSLAIHPAGNALESRRSMTMTPPVADPAAPQRSASALRFYGIASLPPALVARTSGNWGDTAVVTTQSAQGQAAPVTFALTNIHHFATLDDTLFWDRTFDDENCEDTSVTQAPSAGASVVIHAERCRIGEGWAPRLEAVVPAPLSYTHAVIARQVDGFLHVDKYVGLNSEVTVQPGASWTYLDGSKNASFICRSCFLKVDNDAIDAHNAYAKLRPEILRVRLDPHASTPEAAVRNGEQTLILPAAGGFIYYLSKPEYGHDFLYYAHHARPGRWSGSLAADLVWWNFHQPLYGVVQVQENGDNLDAFKHLIRYIGTASIASDK